MAQTAGGFKIGDRVRRISGDKATVGEIVGLIPAVEHPRYAAHPAKARVRFPHPRRLGGNGWTSSSIALSRLVKEVE